ncbi:MAG: peptidylprolyl isomerase, partial [Salinibacter sp.]
MSRPFPLIGLCLLAGLTLACSGPPQAHESAPEASSSTSRAPVVARYADEVITLTELDSAFAASVGGRANAADSSLRAYRRFLKRYVNYRLKVRAARDAGLDTLASIRRDIQRYRQELARPRLLRQKVYEPVVRTLYERRNRAVDVSHILIRPASDQDTLEAYRTIQKIADSLDQGIPFAALAYRNSDDPAARKKGRRGYKGHLGYLRAGQIVPAFEKRMYSVNPGEVSEVFRTKYGYHILKVHDRRPARPPVRLSHILRRPQGDTAEARQFLDSLRTEIRKGPLSFAAAAKKYSQDPRSAAKGGDLGTVRPQALPAALRKAVTALDSVGAVSGVVRSRFGYHLLKLTGRQERKSFDEAYESLKKKVSGQPRIKRRKTSLAHRVRLKHGSTVDTTQILRMADTDSLDALARPLLALTDSSAGPSPVVARLGDSTYTALQMARHLMQTDGGAQMTIAGLIESFLNEKALQYAATRLAQRTPMLRRELKKYREGALLFRYMQDSIWTVAAQDSAGLRATYRKHRSRYR